MRPLLLGGTDLTLAVAHALLEAGIPPSGIIHVGEQVPISYAGGGAITNVRHADLAGWCDRHGIPHCRYEGVTSIEAMADATRAEVALAAGWYHMVPAAARARFPLGALGLHGSLLPKLRGGAPLPWAILSGANETGITLFQLGDGIDDGLIWGQRRFPIEARTTVGDLVRQTEAAAVEMVVECLNGFASGSLQPVSQTGEPTWCLQRIPEDGAIDWRSSAEQIDRLIRAVGRPYPGAFSRLDGVETRIWAAEPLASRHEVWGAPGQIFRLPGHGFPLVVTGAGLLSIRHAEGAEGNDMLPVLLKSSQRRFEVSVT